VQQPWGFPEKFPMKINREYFWQNRETRIR
jgi:hypothetical protein